MSGSEFFDGVLIRSPWRSSGLVCHFLYRGYGFNTKPQQSFFFFIKEKMLIYQLKLRKLSWCLLVINKNNLSHSKSLTCPWGRPLLSCQSGNSRHTPWSPCGLEYLLLRKGKAYDHNYKFRANKIMNSFNLDLSNHLPELCRVLFFFLFFNFLTGEVIMYSWGLT